MKNLKLKITATLIALIIFLQSPDIFSQYDSTAMAVINKMSGTISNMNSCSFKLDTEYDVLNNDLGNVKHSENAQVYMKGSNKFMVEERGDKGHKEILYDGWNLVFILFIIISTLSSRLLQQAWKQLKYSARVMVLNFPVPTFSIPISHRILQRLQEN